ncbi:response regulator transcription factor [Jiulongibacter sediminis]|jgi:DNA-binding response OmpR family regulator|uniref:Transcriptional regulator n=1 Tax=Jiulongibacter sediminis TaxID=1605367 RepID=A0A0P7BJP3_9BACT|nr:response regulator transcription factor [Jiulongibacter sediminis]KPM47429.1 transcriptional regulator [Jiulongibacter sediminis]TBX23008.1 transcriptional regulator [Jiulongibacter sediminis]
MLKTLLLEDDLTLSREVKSFLNSRDIHCDVVYDGNTFARQLRNEEYDAFLLDINVPGSNGLEVCKHIREEGYQNPVIMLTAYGDIEDKKDAYSAGADDFLVKPFHLEELILRINSVLKRGVPEKVQTEVLKVADLEIDLGTKKVSRAQKTIELTKKEFQLLLFLVKANGRVVSKQTIAEQIWDIHFETSLNTIEVYVNFLRRKIDKGHAVALIHTKPGFGYYLREDK